MIKILLIHPPLTAKELFSRGSERSASFIPPLGIAYIAAYLEKFGYECKIIDGVAEPIPLLSVCDISRRYDIIGITVVSTYALRAIELIRVLKDSGITQPIVVGGPHITAIPESLSLLGADYGVVGEGEVTMFELVRQLESGRRELKKILGLVFMEDGRLVYTGRRPYIDPLDQIPMPARHLLPMHLYKSSIARSSRQPSHSMLASRGCPGICTFCSKKTFGTKIRYFSVDRIVEEFFLLRDTYGARDVAVWDDNFVANADVAISVCDHLRKRNFDISWSVEARIDVMTAEVLGALKKAGCTYIAYGIESGSQRVLDHVNKKIKKDTIVEVIRKTHEAGIMIRGYFMFGLTTETLSEMEETIRFAMELDIELASFTVFVPLPATVEYHRALKSGSFPDPEYYHHIIVPEFNFLDHPLYVPKGMTPLELMKMHRQAYNRYYFRPKILMRKLLSIRSKGQILDMINGGWTLIKNAVS